MGTATPAEWAADKAAKLRRYTSDEEFMGALRTARDVLLPGVPLAALCGVAANGGRNENTTGWRTCSEAERAEALRTGKKPLGGNPRDGYGNVSARHLHELGPFGVEAGHVPEDVAGPGTPWADLADDLGVVKALGRPAVTGGAWYGAVADQVVVGVACVRRHAVAMRAKLLAIDPRLAWTADGDAGGPKVWTPWALWPGVAAWSAGEGGLARHVERYASTLAATPEADRLAAFVRCAATYDGDGAKHRRPSYTLVRTAQKARAGLAAVDLTGEGDAARAWLDDRLGADRAAVLAALVRSAEG